MTVASPLAKAGPFLDTGGTSYPFAFQALQAADLKVVRTTMAGDLYSDDVLDPGVDYGVVLNPDQEASPGGTVNTTATVAGTYITIVRNVAPTQGSSIPNQGGFYPEVLERALDKLTMLVQQLKTDVDRSLLLSYADTGTSLDGVIAQLVSAVDAANVAVDSAAASAAAAAASAAGAAASADLAQRWATQTALEVQAGLGFGAKKYAQDAAQSAAEAAASSGIPSVVGNAGKLLGTNGTVATWTEASATLADQAASSALPATGQATVAALLQTVRNALKWLTARFDGTGKAYSAAAADTAGDSTKWAGANKTVSTSGPSGGADGDIWFEREA